MVHSLRLLKAEFAPCIHIHSALIQLVPSWKAVRTSSPEEHLDLRRHF